MFLKGVVILTYKYMRLWMAALHLSRVLRILPLSSRLFDIIVSRGRSVGHRYSSTTHDPKLNSPCKAWTRDGLVHSTVKSAEIDECAGKRVEIGTLNVDDRLTFFACLHCGRLNHWSRGRIWLGFATPNMRRSISLHAWRVRHWR